jgi:ABC-2 type transport system permease protein
VEKIFWLWKREMIRYFRERSRIVTSVVTPLLWIVVFGTGLRGSGFGAAAAATGAGGGADYRVFIFPGIVGMSLLFSSMFTGVNVIWDRQFGILRAVLVAPVSRPAIVTGKAFGGATGAMVQGVILLAFAPLVHVHLTVWNVARALPVMFLIALGIVCIGLLIAVFMESLEGFNLIMSFAIMPMFFLSGALFPLDKAPGWLQKASLLDPLTFGVDALRGILLGSGHHFLHPLLDVALIAAFDAAVLGAAAAAFGRKK